MIAADPLVLALALAMDLTLGDPRSIPHPVALIGTLISFLEGILRRITSQERLAGVLLLLFCTGAISLVTWLALRGADAAHHLLSAALSVYVSWTCLAARSLHQESALVAEALKQGDIAEARLMLSRLVGRDTESLDEPGIWRALVETVAENTTDGIIAPLFWLTAGGPVAGMAFKTVSTLDSMVGYKNERYLYVGWASARMDDLLNFIPARLTALLMVICAPLAGLSARGAIKITLRDRLKHPSPNSGHPEAAAAGALGIRLGGAASYHGVPTWKEQIGEPENPVDERAYRGMIRLMYSVTLIMASACIAGAAAWGGTHV